MALFHLSVTQTKRSAGQSAIASAAYRAGERLYSEYYGEYSDYTRKGGVIYSDIPTISAEKANLDELPAGEREILKLVAKRVVVAVCKPFRYTETTAEISCGDAVFTAKGRQITDARWKQYEKRDEDEPAELPEITEGMSLIVDSKEIHEGRTTAPKRYTEDTLLSAMESAGSKDIPIYSQNAEYAREHGELDAYRASGKAVVAELRAMKLKEAAKKIEDSVEETLTYCDFPSEHWTRIRTNNVIERLNREIRRRTRVVGCFPDGNSALMLVCARLRHVAGTQWGNKKYMNMKHLEAMEDTVSIAG